MTWSLKEHGYAEMGDLESTLNLLLAFSSNNENHNTPIGFTVSASGKFLIKFKFTIDVIIVASAADLNKALWDAMHKVDDQIILESTHKKKQLEKKYVERGDAKRVTKGRVSNNASRGSPV